MQKTKKRKFLGVIAGALTLATLVGTMSGCSFKPTKNNAINSDTLTYTALYDNPTTANSATGETLEAEAVNSSNVKMIIANAETQEENYITKELKAACVDGFFTQDDTWTVEWLVNNEGESAVATDYATVTITGLFDSEGQIVDTSISNAPAIVMATAELKVLKPFYDSTIKITYTMANGGFSAYTKLFYKGIPTSCTFGDGETTYTSANIINLTECYDYVGNLNFYNPIEVGPTYQNPEFEIVSTKVLGYIIGTEEGTRKATGGTLGALGPKEENYSVTAGYWLGSGLDYADYFKYYTKEELASFSPYEKEDYYVYDADNKFSHVKPEYFLEVIPSFTNCEEVYLCSLKDNVLTLTLGPNDFENCYIQHVFYGEEVSGIDTTYTDEKTFLSNENATVFKYTDAKYLYNGTFCMNRLANTHLPIRMIIAVRDKVSGLSFELVLNPIEDTSPIKLDKVIKV